MSAFLDFLATLPSQQRSLSGGESLFRRNQRVRACYIVCDGAIGLERMTEQGQRLLLQRADAGAVIAEPSLLASSYHCDALALTAAQVKIIAIKPILDGFADPAIFRDFAKHLAREVQTARVRAEILAMRRIGDRLDAWLNLRDGALPPKGAWHLLANDLGVTPEALYRELAQRRKRESR